MFSSSAQASPWLLNKYTKHLVSEKRDKTVKFEERQEEHT